MTHHRADEVLAFWFGPGADYGKRHKRWFEKSAALDAEVTLRYRDLCDQLAHEREWLDAPRERLAPRLGLDQFPRPIYPGPPRAFAPPGPAPPPPPPPAHPGDEAGLFPGGRPFLHLPVRPHRAAGD